VSWLDRMRPQRMVLQLTKQQAILWQWRDGKWASHASVGLDGVTLLTPEALVERLNAIDWPQSGRFKLEMVLESAWMPITCIDTKGAAWSVQEFRAIAMQRWGALFGTGAEHWDAQSDYLPGDTTGCAFGLPMTLKLALRGWAQKQHLSGLQILPAVNWAALQSNPPLVRAPGQRLLFLEADRSLLLEGRVGRFLPVAWALPPADGPAQCRSLLSGLESSTQGVAVLSWESLQGADVMAAGPMPFHCVVAQHKLGAQA
jgi:hypothetical protein